MKTELKIILMAGTLLLTAVGQAEPASSPVKKEYPFWRLVAKSYRIVEGTVDAPLLAILQAAKKGEHEYVPVALTVGRTLKGDPGASTLIFRYYTDTEQYGGVSREQIAQLNKRPAIVFLQKVREKYYLAVYAPETMQSASEALAMRVREETALQEKLIQESDRYAGANVLPKESEVQSLIEMMVDKQIAPGGAQAVYEALIGLGKEAIPAMVKYMDDRRKLVIPKITLIPWWPDAEEGLVHYGPETVTDVVSIALMVLTDESLTSIYNGGTELERQQAVRIWKIHERRTYGQPVTR